MEGDILNTLVNIHIIIVFAHTTVIMEVNLRTEVK